MTIALVAASDISAASAHPGWFTIPIALGLLSICIALCAFAVGFLNFRLSRFPHVRLKVQCDMHTDHEVEPPLTEDRLVVEVESWGLPIWDAYAKLEALYKPGEASMGHLQVVLPSVGTRPQPMAPGQVAKFQVTRQQIERGLIARKAQRSIGLSELPPERCSIAIYGSGGRLIKRIKSDKFPYHFKGFDKIQGAVKGQIQTVFTSLNVNPDESK